MKLNKIVTAAALALTAMASFAGGGPLTFVGSTASFSSSALIGDSPITDIYTFSVVGDGSANGVVTSSMLAPSDFDFTSIVLAGPSGSFAYAQLLGDPNETWALNPVTLSSGDYTLTVTGTITAPATSGSYGGNLNVTPVPEPETYALMLAGLGAMAFVARRRKSA